MRRFLDFKSAAGNNLLSEWYCQQSFDCRAMFDSLLEVLGKSKEWKYPEFKFLDDGIGEIRWNAGKVQHRVMGCSWKDPHGYLLLIGCTHKQNIYSPPDALATAKKRRNGPLYQGKGS